MYNLLYYQVITQVSCGLTHAERNAVIGRAILNDITSTTTSEIILRSVITYFRDSKLYNSDDASSSSTNHARIRSHVIEQQVNFFFFFLIEIE